MPRLSKIDDSFEMLDEAQEPSKKLIVVLACLALLALAGFGGYYLWQNYGPVGVPRVAQTPAPAPAPAPAPTPAPAPAPAPAPTKKVPTPVNIVINFDSGSYAINPDQMVKLQNLARLITDNPGSMQISAYTDDEGSDEAGQWLSEQRAQAVVQVFKSLGVNGTIKYNVNAYGELYPIGDNSTPEGRALNRRVEIYYSPAKQ